MTPSADSTETQVAGRVVVPAGLVSDDEQIILALKPSGWFVLLVSVPGWIVIAAAAIVADLLRYKAHFVSRDHIVTLAVAAGLVRLAIAVAQWLARVYLLTDRRVLRVMGVLHVRVFEAPLARVQNTFLSMTLIERLLGLGTILFATAGTGAAEAGWWLIARPREVHAIVVETIRRAQSGRNGEKP